MTAKLLDGNAVSKQIRDEIKTKLARTKSAPTLAVVLCGDNPASEIYVERKRKACEEVGIHTRVLRRGVSPYYLSHVLHDISMLNQDPWVNGILVQLPLPKPEDQYRIFDQIDPMKDVDVFSPVNVGLLLQGRPRYVPCTPAAVQELLLRHGLTTVGKKVTIINRSDVVGKPLHALLVQNHEFANATVTVCHDSTPPFMLKSICLASEIIVVAVGKKDFLTADMVPKGAVVVDVGINRIPDTKKIVGDAVFAEVAEKAAWISPVPGGVGPCTVACLLLNVVRAQELQLNNSVSHS